MLGVAGFSAQDFGFGFWDQGNMPTALFGIRFE